MKNYVFRSVAQRGSANFYDATYLQDPGYAMEVSRRERSTVETFELDCDGVTVARWTARVKRIPGLRAGMAYIQHGPMVIRDMTCRVDDVSEILAQIRVFYNDRGLTIRIVPADLCGLAWDDMSVVAAFERAGFAGIVVPRRRSIFVDLRRSLEDVRKSFDPKWRNKLNSALKSPQVVTERVSAVEYFDTLHQMHVDLELKKRFSPQKSMIFFKNVYMKMTQSADMVIYIGKVEQQIASFVLCDMSGAVAISILAATNEIGRRHKVSNAVQWALIEDAHRAGKSWYDTGGINPQENPGVYEFKKNMGGIDRHEVGLFEAQASGYAGRLVKLSTSIVKAYQRARRPLAAR